MNNPMHSLFLHLSTNVSATNSNGKSECNLCYYMNVDFFSLVCFVVQIPESDASILSITIDREASYMAAVNNQVSKNVNTHCNQT